MAQRANTLINDLASTCTATLSAATATGLGRIVYADSGWQVKDVLIHLTFNFTLRANHLAAFINGTTYEPPPAWQLRNPRVDLHKRNNMIFAERRHYRHDRAIVEYQAVFQRLRQLVGQLADDDLATMVPSGLGAVSLEQTIVWVVDHDTHHRREIEALQP